ncbi:hypothetical protein HD806DRAFT_501013 [Xylariaceae sp. AK1471]|nr:hypothetical protein HD806DRAFT_501013 [Xylariaceae sp. AK1471]
MPDFEFVNVDRPGDEKRHATKIRRHVMKDIGKSRRKPKKRSETTIAKAISVDARSQSQCGQAVVPSPLDEYKLNEIVFPTVMDGERMNLARYLFTEARNSYRPFRFPWLFMGLSDASAWHITMANAVIFKTMKPGDAKPEFGTNTEALKWYTLSLESISKRLADPTERSKEGIIVAIAGFICHDSSTGNFARQEIHMQGLKRLLDDRGGIDKITNPLLRYMISWHDLTGASYRNSTPYFGVPKGSITNIDTGNDTEYFKSLLDSWDEKCPYLGDIRSALKATAAVASYLNQHCHAERFWTEDVLAARLLAPALYEVLSLEGRALPSDPSHLDYSGTAAREAFRRSLLIFLASIKAKFGAVTFELRRHLDDFRQISQIPHVEWTVVPEFNLWAHTIAALQEDIEQRSWNVSAIVSIMESMGSVSGQQALDMVRGIIWVEALFADKTEALRHEIDSFIACRPLNLSVDHRPGEIVDPLNDERLVQTILEASSDGWNNAG